MITDLLTRLEDEKDQWIYEAVARFNERFPGFGGQRYDGPGTLEDQVLEMKNILDSLRKQTTLNLERMETEIKTMEAGKVDEQRRLEDLVSTIESLQRELAIYDDADKRLERVQLEKFQFLLEYQFTFDKKDQVVFKERKVSKLLEGYEMVEGDMLDFYHRQLSNCWLMFKNSMENILPHAKFDVETNPPVVDLRLNHGRGLDQYLILGNFEEDYRIVHDTLEMNNNTVYEYYDNQITQFKKNSREEMMRLVDHKNEYRRLAEEQVQELQENIHQREKRFIELQDQYIRVKQEWEQDLLRPNVLDEFLKEEFVRTVSGWQEKLFSENASDEERWAYHQYCQIILKQAERIIGNEYF
ncbi:ElaB/YqjD/DUF883 family membrane-anchored ribosome-binding protein [Neobacillus niacini]|uniref:hypothetical protein n=1 Tax=Neobacillus niacini TaxID=86668 RepID=UPI0027819130|nr:hypothetical protein [Neobacillus niacini]MDQ1000563.1 ElaB/YqjD/DUF883 family membrane-anchored ribosome-binding protein [Neobacillus niacini]